MADDHRHPQHISIETFHMYIHNNATRDGGGRRRNEIWRSIDVCDSFSMRISRSQNTSHNKDEQNMFFFKLKSYFFKREIPVGKSRTSLTKWHPLRHHKTPNKHTEDILLSSSFYYYYFFCSLILCHSHVFSGVSFHILTGNPLRIKRKANVFLFVLKTTVEKNIFLDTFLPSHFQKHQTIPIYMPFFYNSSTSLRHRASIRWEANI